MIRFALAIAVASLGSLAIAGEKKGFVVHEWGTFSTFSGSDGQGLKFYPNDTDLPNFVHSRRFQTKGGVTDVLVSLETPVLYFYSDRDLTASVHVAFPKGVMTDWYPEASRPPHAEIRWDNLKVLAKDRPKLLEMKETSRYYAARDVEAASVTALNEGKPEHEKFLFYRGVGDFAMPFEVKALGQNKFTIRNTGTHAVPAFFLVNVAEGKATFKQFGKLDAAATETATLPTTSGSLEDAMVKVLTTQGLDDAEAKAMVKTWKADWFGENGTRVLYVVSEKLTEDLLPITITPKPDGLVRVLVGRHDVLTPEREVAIDALVKRIHGESNEDAKAAEAEMAKLGRYRSAAQTASEKRLKLTRR